MTPLPLSVLEVALVETGRTAAEAFTAATDIAGHVADLGFRRVWLAEHHGSLSIGSASPPVLAAHFAANTQRIRIGSGGVLLPNHAPLVIAEQFATLAALHPGRIDLGIGRGPGTFDPTVARALRRGGEPATDADYRADIEELLAYLAGERDIRLVPGPDPIERAEPWLLSSSSAGAQIAAELGLPIAFAHHIRPANTVEALERYRDHFRPSRWRDEPYAMVAVRAVCADTDAEAARLARPLDLLAAKALSGQGDTALLPLDEAQAVELSPEAAEKLAVHKADQAQGSPETVAARLAEVAARTGADELMLASGIYDVAARRHCYDLIAKAVA